jgi:hypothetical protein
MGTLGIAIALMEHAVRPGKEPSILEVIAEGKVLRILLDLPLGITVRSIPAAVKREEILAMRRLSETARQEKVESRAR